MNQRLKNTLLLVLLVATLGSGTLAWQQYHARLNAVGADSGSDDSAALRKRLADAEHRAHDLENELAALKARQTADNAPSDEPPPPPNDGNGPRFERMGGRPDGAFRELMNDPKVIALINAREKTMLDQRYAQLFKSLIDSGKLTPEQIEAFKNLMVERQNTMRDIRQSAREQGITDRSQIDALVKSTQAELDAQLQNTLGADAYAAYQSYEKTYPQRTFVNQFAQSLSYTSTPLTAAQSQQLIDILASSSTSGSNQRRGGFGGNNVAVTDATVTAAATVLSPAQLAALNNVKNQQAAQEALRQQIRAARQSTATATTSTATTGNATR